jgi:hypothetical protein
MNESMGRITAEITAVIERGLREEMLRQREAALEVELAAIRAEIGQLGGKGQIPLKAKKPVFAPAPAPKPAPNNRPMNKKSAHVMLIEVLKNARRPMTVRELTNAILRRGWKTILKNPRGTFDKALRKNTKDFRRVAPGMFELIR